MTGCRNKGLVTQRTSAPSPPAWGEGKVAFADLLSVPFCGAIRRSVRMGTLRVKRPFTTAARSSQPCSLGRKAAHAQPPFLELFHRPKPG
jgi:hypothetical protein